MDTKTNSIESVNLEVNKTTKNPVVESEKQEAKWLSKECPVVAYVASNGILGFTFDGIPCQITVDKGLETGQSVKIKYQGNIEKGIKFKL